MLFHLLFVQCISTSELPCVQIKAHHLLCWNKLNKEKKRIISQMLRRIQNELIKEEGFFSNCFKWQETLFAFHYHNDTVFNLWTLRSNLCVRKEEGEGGQFVCLCVCVFEGRRCKGLWVDERAPVKVKQNRTVQTRACCGLWKILMLWDLKSCSH